MTAAPAHDRDSMIEMVTDLDSHSRGFPDRIKDSLRLIILTLGHTPAQPFMKAERSGRFFANFSHVNDPVFLSADGDLDALIEKGSSSLGNVTGDNDVLRSLINDAAKRVASGFFDYEGMGDSDYLDAVDRLVTSLKLTRCGLTGDRVLYAYEAEHESYDTPFTGEVKSTVNPTDQKLQVVLDILYQIDPDSTLAGEPQFEEISDHMDPRAIKILSIGPAHISDDRLHNVLDETLRTFHLIDDSLLFEKEAIATLNKFSEIEVLRILDEDVGPSPSF